MFQDEARFGRISDTRRCWCPKPTRPMCKMMVTQEYTYAYSAVSVCDGVLDTLILPHVNTECMGIFLNEVASRHPSDRIVLVLDGAGWHKATTLSIPKNMRLLPLPPYAPELNPVEHLWDELREKSFCNRVFDSIESLENHLVFRFTKILTILSDIEVKFLPTINNWGGINFFYPFKNALFEFSF